MHKNVALALENITRLTVVSNRSNIDSTIMIHLESMVQASNQEHPFTSLSLREVQCFVRHSLARSSVIPIRSSTGRRKCVNATLVHATSPLAKPTLPLANNDIVGDHEGVDGKNVDHLHIEELSKFHSDDYDDGEEEEILPKVIEPFSLDYLLNNPLPREESLGATICNFAESLVTTFLTPSQLKPSIDPHEVLSGLFAPVCETDPTHCRITRGHLPKDLNGVYLRNGPNATLLHHGEGFHLFDGDGMIHSIMMRNGSASFCSRFVQTSRFRQEQAAGKPLFAKFFGGMYGPSGVARVLISSLRAAFGLVDLTNGAGLSNTSVAFFNGHVLSLSEEDMPYIVKITEDGDIVTLRQFKLPSKSNMCAHPKFDPISGEMYAFSLNLPFFPPFSVFRVSADGVKSADIPVPLLDVPLVHDFAITQRFIIFPDNQLVMRPMELAKGEMPLTCDPNKTPRFCLLPRYALPEESASKTQWFEAPGVNCLHYVNAWDEGADEVVLITSVLSPAEKILQIPANCSSSLSEIRFNTRTGGVEQRIICSGIELEFGVINQKYTGRKTRYAYFAKGGFPYYNAVVKVDLTQSGAKQESVVGMRVFEEGRYGGEPFFVEARGAKSEDHGYLLCLVGDEKGGVSELLVMDALSPSLEVIAAIELPVRVPAGFHGCFITQEQLKQQKP